MNFHVIFTNDSEVFKILLPSCRRSVTNLIQFLYLFNYFRAQLHKSLKLDASRLSVEWLCSQQTADITGINFDDKLKLTISILHPCCWMNVQLLLGVFRWDANPIAVLTSIIILDEISFSWFLL
jgi:hypothetical protein